MSLLERQHYPETHDDVRILDCALRVQGIDVNKKILSKIINTFLLIKEKGEECSLKDISQLEALYK